MMLVSYSSISQTVTVENKTEVVLEKPVAKDVVRDLIRGDAAIADNDVLNAVIKTQRKQLQQEKDVATVNKIISDNMQSIINQNKVVVNEQDVAIKSLNSSLYSQKNKTLFYKVTTFAALAVAGYLLVQ